MLNIVLYEREIPPNTGNIIRLCVNTGSHLDLVEPLGFTMDDKRLRRAGLDYRARQRVEIHTSWTAFVASAQPQRLFAISTKGDTRYADIAFQAGDTLVFGPETRGLAVDFLAAMNPQQRLFIPMQPGSRSLNLSNAVAVVVYEAWRQLGYVNARL